LRIDLNKLFSKIPLLRRALEGDAEATRQYCGSYKLIRHRETKKLYRCEGATPLGYRPIFQDETGRSVYDRDGFLRDKFWSLPRIINGIER